MFFPTQLNSKVRYVLHKKLRQTHRISRKSLEFSALLIGAALVALFLLVLPNWQISVSSGMRTGVHNIPLLFGLCYRAA